MNCRVERGKLIVSNDDIFRLTVYEHETLTDKWRTVHILFRSKRHPEEFEVVIDGGKAKRLISEMKEMLKL